MKVRRALRGARPPTKVSAIPEAATRADAQLLCQTVIAFLLALLRCGYSKGSLSQIVTSAFQHLPELLGAVPVAPRDELNDPAHLLTVWRSQPPYLHNGRPRPLPLRGPAPSIESLIREVNPRLKLQTVMAYLQAANALTKVGRRFAPATDTVSTYDTPYHASNQLQTLSAALLNFDHNYGSKDRPRWYDFHAECPRFPVEKLPQFLQYVYEQAPKQLFDYDAFIRRYERRRRPGQRTVRVGIEILQYIRTSSELSRELVETQSRVLRGLGIASQEPSSGADRKRPRR